MWRNGSTQVRSVLLYVDRPGDNVLVTGVDRNGTAGCAGCVHRFLRDSHITVNVAS